MTSSITCPRCGMTSHHPGDAREGYCGNCHDWTREDPASPSDAGSSVADDARFDAALAEALVRWKGLLKRLE